MNSKGSIVFVEHHSKILQGNPLDDPHVRSFPVYLPPGYENSSEKRYPVIFGLIGFSGTGAMYLNNKFLSSPFGELLDQL